MLKRIECVPNLSEGRRPEVIDAICTAVERTPGVLLLNRSSDPDHNRTVLTLVGSPDGLKAAVLTLFEAAQVHIDLRQHQGRHPRMGAVDVVPFIPLRDATVADCIALARETAQAVAERFAVPIYLYADAATRPERTVLSAVRKGQFEGLAAKMADPDWRPDFGPDHPHPSLGASAFGARFFLIAYNLQLDTADLKIAQAIARAVRTSSGGLMHVQAMGVMLDARNQAQVSMNLLHYEKTPIHLVQERVKAEAARYGAHVVSAEVVGLVPQAALLEAAAHTLQIENWDPDLTLENAIRKQEATRSALSSLALPDLLDRIASAEATPGGGSAAALAGALGASLTAMVSGLTAARPGSEGVSEPLAEIGNRSRTQAAALTRAIDDDARAYEAVMAARRLPRGDAAQHAERKRAVQSALHGATDTPLHTAQACLEAADLALTALKTGNPNASSDAAVGVMLALAGMEGAILNVATNLGAIEDADYVAAATAEIGRLTGLGNALWREMSAIVRERVPAYPRA